jgi:hypothetical protein
VQAEGLRRKKIEEQKKEKEKGQRWLLSFFQSILGYFGVFIVYVDFPEYVDFLVFGLDTMGVLTLEWVWPGLPSLPTKRSRSRRRLPFGPWTQVRLRGQGGYSGSRIASAILLLLQQ